MRKAAHWVLVAEPQLYQIGQRLFSAAQLDNRESVTVYEYH